MPLARAFATQAASDLDAFETLTATTLPTCHRLHYLQMWLEKLCKAYLWLPDGDENLRTLHNVVDKILPRMISEYWRRIGFQQRPDITAIRALCREVDLLHPQVDDNGRRPDNVEYPWIAAGGAATAPAAWQFPLAARLNTHTGRLLMKLSRDSQRSSLDRARPLFPSPFAARPAVPPRCLTYCCRMRPYASLCDRVLA